MPTTIKINAANWTGREVEVTILSETRFKLYDYEFRLEKQTYPDLPELTEWRIFSKDWPADYCLGVVSHWNDEATFTAGSDLGIRRDSDTPIKAAAQLLCNLI